MMVIPVVVHVPVEMGGHRVGRTLATREHWSMVGMAEVVEIHLSLRLPILPTAPVAGESVLIGTELAHLTAKLAAQKAGPLICRHGR